MRTRPEFLAALELYLKPYSVERTYAQILGDWKAAYEGFNKIQQENPEHYHDYVAEIMAERLQKMIAETDKNPDILTAWDGVFTFTEK